MTFEDFQAMTKRTVEAVGSDLDPQDDWSAQLLMLTEDDGLVIGAIDPAFFSSPEAKDGLADMVLPGLVAQHKAVMAAFITTSWMAKVDTKSAYGRARLTPDGGTRIPVSQLPDRIEAVTVMFASRDEIGMATAEIERHQSQPPTLKPWEDMGGGAAIGLGGRFGEGLQRAFGQEPPDTTDQMRKFLG